MSIKYRVIILLTSLAIVYVLIVSQVMRLGVLPAFSALERDFATVDRDRVGQYVQAEWMRLGGFAYDWAYWTDNQNYMLGLNPEFEADDLTEDMLDYLHVNIFALIDTDYNLKWGRAYDLEQQIFLSIEDYLQFPIVDAPEVFGLTSIDDSSQGIYKSAGLAMLFTSRPILNNSREGPVAGTLVLGRFLDEHFIKEMEEALSLELNIWDLDESLPAYVRQAQSEISGGSADVTWIENDAQLRQLFQITDFYGIPSFIAEIQSPRRIVDIGNETVGTAVYVLVVALVLFTLVIWFILDKLVLAPLRRLQTHIHEMREDDDLSRHINITRTDEFGDMAREFNALTEKLMDSRQESESARQSAIAASESKSNFLATMSHEIRTPMNGVLGMADLLLSTPSLSAEQKHYAKTISHSGKALLIILNDILDFSKIEAGKFTLENSPFQLRAMLEDALELVAHEAQGKGLELLLEVPPDLRNRYIGDAGRLRQMILNLLSNAVKFTESGRVTLRVTMNTKGHDDSCMLFEVEDTGIGIRQENHDKIFGSFTQEDNSTTRRFGGTGLGLAVTRQLAELMGGQAGFSSDYGSGSTFWVSIPLPPSKLTTVSQQNQFGGSRALLYLGESASNRILKSQLEFWGVDVKTNNDVSQIDTIFETDFTLTDGSFNLLFIDGVIVNNEVQQAMKLLRSKYDEEQLRIVLLCPISDATNLADLSDFGTPRVLYKPVRLERLTSLFRDEVSVADSQSSTNLDLAQGDSIDSPKQPRHVLLVEDNRVNVMIAENMLKKLSYEVTVANNGEEAVELTANNTFDIVLMDCAMPVMDGFEATKLIRETEAASNSGKVTIIALTANAMIEDRDRCLLAGMDGFLTKPISLDALRESLQR
ncbi:MAG: response regulator [Proteobacteria bacterium]|nr:response regulator [Pseudomonadota bacterium]